MRVAMFTEVFLPKVDGITNRLRHTIDCLLSEGHELLLFAPDTAVPEYAGARIVRVPALPFPPYPGVRAALPDPRVLLELLAFRPHVVHAVGPACLGVWGILCARALRLPTVASYHTDFPRYLPGYRLEWARGLLWPLIRQIHNAATLNLCPSRFTERELREQGVRNVGIWKGGVDTDLFHPSKRSIAMRVRLSGGRPERPILLYVGRLSPEKNVETLAWILDAVPSATLALVGDGPARRNLERVFQGDPVTFTGFLRGEELAAAFASADVFVMPSTTETLGFVVLEAMSSGCPVVAARAGGIPDLVQHEGNGLLYDPEDLDEAIAAVRRILSERGQARFYAQQARKHAENCSWAAETRKLEHSYRRAVSVQRRRSLLSRVLHPRLA